MAEKLGLGYLVTGLIVLGVIAAAGIAWRLGLDAVLAFWIAYILTRPLGASLGDYLSQSQANGGLGNYPQALCLAAGMPHMMIGFLPSVCNYPTDSYRRFTS